MKTILPGVSEWSWYSQEKGYDFNGHLIESGQDRVLIDPPLLPKEDQERLRQGSSIVCIILTNRDHAREAAIYKKLFHTRILVHELDAPSVGIPVDGTFKDGHALPAGLKVIHIPHSKSAGESALFLSKGRGILLLGDALIGKPPGSLNMMPADKFADVTKAREGLKVLLRYEYEMVLVGDGASILSGGRQVIQRFLKA